MINLSFKSYGCGMGSMDNGPFNIKQIFVEYKQKGLAGSWKTGRFIRFAGSTGGLNGSMPVRPQNGSLRWTEPESWPVGGSIGRTGRSGPVFKTLQITENIPKILENSHTNKFEIIP